MQSLWMLLATFLFALMGVCVKLAADLYSTSEIVMYRGLVGMVLIYGLTHLRGGTLATNLPWSHFGRSAVGIVALWMWFHSISLLPLATSMTLNYTAPIWMAIILFAAGWWQGRSRFEWRLALAILTSFLGITLLLRPTIQLDQWVGGVLALSSGMLSSLAYLQVRRLGRLGEPEYRVVFYFSLTGVIAGILAGLASPLLPSVLQSHLGADVGSAAIWHSHTPYGFALLMGIGISAAMAQMALTRAYHLGKTLLSANLQYTGIVFASFWGVIVWGDVLRPSGWLGIVLIAGSGCAATYYTVQAGKKASAA